MPNPDKILVCGSSSLTIQLHPFAQALGRAIVETSDLVLITGGFKEGISKDGLTKPLGTDFLVASSAMEALYTLNIDASQRIITMLPQSDFDSIRRFPYGHVVIVKKSNLRSRRYSMVLTSDAVIAIEGHDGTEEIIDLAWVAGKPILPIPCTGGAAQRTWTRYKQELLAKFEVTSNELDFLESLSSDVEHLAKLSVSLVRRCLKPRCFVAMKIGNPPMPLAFETMRRVIDRKGYMPIRVDQEPFLGSIVEAIWNAIRSSDVVIADITDYNPNVFYELGIAHALSKPTILTVFNEYGRVPQDIPFDIRIQRVLTYGTVDSLEKQLDQHIPRLKTYSLGN